ncbi:hypothetical protein HMPREF9231_1153 [Gardnerella vaginalis HMP9231]|nr:hypothetical protein HMPREF9231_1153 [Gardnerella vaginalis HMP9231]
MSSLPFLQNLQCVCTYNFVKFTFITLLSLHLGIDLIQYLAKYLVKLCAVL